MNITRQLLVQSWRSWYDIDVRRVGPEWLQLVWTVLFAAAIGLLFTVFGVANHNDWADPARWWRWYRVNFVISLSVSLCIHALFAGSTAWLTRERIRRFSSRQRGFYFAGLPMLGVVVGWPLGMWLVGADVAGWVRISSNQLLGSAVVALVINSFIFMLYASRARRLTAEKRAAEAQLRLLQAQIEPHFLFNTLANVESLLDHDLPKAQQLVLEVQDDGRGLNAPPRPGPRRNTGMALANIRQRLMGHYGTEATLELQALQTGTLARMRLPLDTATTP